MTTSTNPTPRSSISRRRFRFGRFVVVMTVLSLLVGYFIVAPTLVKRAIRQALHDYGEDVVAFDVEGLSLTSARLTGVALGGPQWLVAREIRVGYTPLSLWRGRVKTVNFDGVEWTLRVRDGRIDPGIETPKSSGSSEFDLPFDVMSVSNATIHLEVDGHAQSVSANALVRRATKGRFEAQVELDAQRLESQGVIANTPHIAASAVLASVGGALTVEGAVDIRASRAEMQSQSLGMQDFSASVPFAIGSAPVDAGRFQTGSITWRGVDLPGLAGSISLAETRLRTEFNWPLTADAVLQGNAWVDFGEGPLRGNVVASVPPFDLIDTSTLVVMVPQLDGVAIGGRYSVDAVIAIEGPTMTPRITLTGERMTVQKSDWPGSIDDAETRITINSFQPLATEPGQMLIVNRATIGEVDVTDASFGFTLESPQRLNMQHASWHMADDASLGRFTLVPFVVEPANPRFKSILRCEDVGLGPWLELLTSDRVTGEGTLAGLINFAFDPHTAQMITLGNGVLEARPQRGTIRIKDEALARKLLEQIDVGDQKYVVQVRDRIVSALQDFEYSSLSAEFSPEEGDYVCELRTAGRGRVGEDPQEFAGIDVSIHHFNALVRDAVIGRNLYERIRE